MNETVLLISVGLVLLLLLLLWARRSAREMASARDDSAARSALRALEFGIPSRRLARRIFASEDWDYVSSRAPSRIQRVLLRERTRIALKWLDDTVEKVNEVIEAHKVAARRHKGLLARVELRLALNYAAFLLFCLLVRMVIRSQGPFLPGRLVGYTVTFAENVSVLAARLAIALEGAARGNTGIPDAGRRA